MFSVIVIIAAELLPSEEVYNPACSSPPPLIIRVVYFLMQYDYNYYNKRHTLQKAALGR
jgi:hypothetical protein